MGNAGRAPLRSGVRGRRERPCPGGGWPGSRLRLWTAPRSVLRTPTCLAGWHSWGAGVGGGPPYKARAGNAGPHRLGTAPLPCPPRSRQAPDPGSSGLPPPSPPALASGCSWGDSPWPSIDTAEALPCCWPWGPPRWPGGPCEQVPQGRPRGLCRVSSQERWFRNSSSGLGQGRSPCPDPPRASAGVRVREPPRASPPLVLECSSSSSPTFPLLWREALFGPVPALGGRRGALPPLAPGARASSSPFPSRGVCFSPLPSRRRAS